MTAIRGKTPFWKNVVFNIIVSKLFNNGNPSAEAAFQRAVQTGRPNKLQNFTAKKNYIYAIWNIY